MCSIILRCYACLLLDLHTDYKVQVRFLDGDLAKKAEVQSLAQKSIELGGVDILVNNAGIQVQL